MNTKQIGLYIVAPIAIAAAGLLSACGSNFDSACLTLSDFVNECTDGYLSNSSCEESTGDQACDDALISLGNCVKGKSCKVAERDCKAEVKTFVNECQNL